MDAKKRERYEKISIELTRLVGGKENIQGVAHCATRLRIVLKDNDQADLKAIEDVDLAKGVFVAGDQVQIIFGAGLVNDVYEVFAEHNNMKNMSLSDLKTVANKKMNPLQRIIKALSDVFVDIMPGILAAALLTGLSGVLGNLDFVKANETLFGINRLINISSGAIFGFLPLAVAYSACKRFGGRPILGIVMGCIMLSNSLADAYAAAQGTVEVTTLHIFGLGVDLVGFQGGIIVALLMGFVTAKLDIFFEKKVPEVIRLLLSPLLTTLVGAILLFTIIGPAGRGLSSGITNALVWMTQNLGVFGYAVFSGLQQLVVITGLHHIFGAIEAQLLADTGRNFINPLMSVAIIAQGGAVIPEEGKVYAPADGTVLSVFDTKHAVCFASKYGTEILIHIGVDTVNLQGKYFTAHVKDGDAVKKGQLMIEFDKEQIQKAGYDTVIPMIFTDLPDDRRLEVSAPGKMTADRAAAVIRKA